MIRRRRHPSDSIGRALRRVRLLIGLAAVVLSLVAMQRSGGITAIVGLSCGVLLLATIAGERGLRRVAGPVAASSLIVVIDTAIAISVLGLHGVHPGDPAGLLLVLPLIEAGVRLGVFGAFVTWFLTSLAIFGQLTVEWDGTPGQVAGPMGYAIGLLLIALPAAALSDHLAERMHAIGVAGAAVDARAATLADALAASVAVTRADPDDRQSTVLEHARRIGADGIRDASIERLVEHPNAHANDPDADEDGRAIVRLPIGGEPPLALCVTTYADFDTFALEALELLALTARTTSRQAAPQQVMVDQDATVEQIRRDLHRDLDRAPIQAPQNMGIFDRRTIEQMLGGDFVVPRAVQVALVSLDNLKLLNDLHGFEAGDALLRATAERLAAIDGVADIGWLGGEEFLVVAEIADASTSLRLTIRQALDGQVELGAAGRTTIHSGVGMAIAGDSDFAAPLVRRARESMFADKREQNRSFLAQVEAELAGHLTGTLS